MGFQCGIVGLPNVGKSTLFNALTQAGIPAENYPFCTIAPNVGIVSVPDPRLSQLAHLVKPQKIIPTTMQFVDIAGLVKGASKGEGLGNQFLHHIRETDAIAHVIRCFEDTDVTHVHGTFSPQEDIDTIHTELLLSDLDLLEKAFLKNQKLAKAGDKLARTRLPLLEALQAHLNKGEAARTFPESEPWLHELCLITLKPMMFIANVDDQDLSQNTYLQQLETIAQKEKAPVIAICCALESEMAGLTEEEKQVFLEDLHLSEPGLNRVIRAGYQCLRLQTYFTAGKKEVRAWTIPVGATAPQAAGKIHSDFERGFIRAEVIAFEDYIAYQGELSAKEAGKWRLEGKDYIVQDGDVIHFRFNVS